MKTIASLLLTLLTMQSYSQEIAGRILDEKKEPLPNTVIQVYQGKTLVGSNVTDYDGNYAIKPLETCNYDVLSIYPGYDSIKVTGVVVLPGQRTTQSFTMLRHIQGQKGIVTKAYKKLLINDENGTVNRTLPKKEEAVTVPTTPWCCEPWDELWFPREHYQQQRGQSANIGGARSTGLHTIDVVPVLTTIVSNMECTTTPITFGVLTRKQLDQIPWTNVRDLVALFPGVYQVRSGDEVSIFGSRMR